MKLIQTWCCVAYEYFLFITIQVITILYLIFFTRKGKSGHEVKYYQRKKWSRSRIIISTLIYLTYLAILWSSPAWLYCINPGCFLCSGMIYNSIPCSVRLLQPSTQQPPRLLWFGKLYLIKICNFKVIRR